MYRRFGLSLEASIHGSTERALKGWDEFDRSDGMGALQFTAQQREH